mmetsp:Transcript_52385/g.161294  ORF Transcript_52385/g.161294 Transcript_52385/m.161294 type:complete len:241 (+) Transcript_52385:748-1470(+)
MQIDARRRRRTAGARVAQADVEARVLHPLRQDVDRRVALRGEEQLPALIVVQGGDVDVQIVHAEDGQDVERHGAVHDHEAAVGADGDIPGRHRADAQWRGRPPPRDAVEDVRVRRDDREVREGALRKGEAHDAIETLFKCPFRHVFPHEQLVAADAADVALGPGAVVRHGAALARAEVAAVAVRQLRDELLKQLPVGEVGDEHAAAGDADEQAAAGAVERDGVDGAVHVGREAAADRGRA